MSISGAGRLHRGTILVRYGWARIRIIWGFPGFYMDLWFTKRVRWRWQPTKRRSRLVRPLSQTGGLRPSTAPSLPTSALTPADRIRRLAAERELDDSLAYQSAAVAALQALTRVLRSEEQAAQAAISLAQGTMLHDMVGTVEALRDAVQETLGARGATMLALAAPERASAAADEESWWFALVEAMTALEEGAAWVAGLGSGQPKHSPVRLLCSIVARVLHRHHKALLAEAKEWMD